LKKLLLQFHMLPVCLALSAGCSSRPHAPGLRDEPIYQNALEGFRFVVPDGWTQYAKAEVAPGKAETERLLVEYRLINSEKPAALRVTRIDLEPAVQLETYLSGPSFGKENWRQKGPAESFQINAVTGLRFVIASAAAKGGDVREVVAFRRGDKVLLFTGFFASTDTKAREQVRRAIDSIIWK
jgi:predicted Zn-dependent protease